MVLWELTLATAYFLGLKRTYRLGLRIQRRVVPRRFQSFTKRRTRIAFDMVLKVRSKLAGLDKSSNKRFSNWILGIKPPVKPNAAAPPLPLPPPAEAAKANKIDKIPPTFPGMQPKIPFQLSKIIPPAGRRENQSSERFYSVVPLIERSFQNRRLVRKDIAIYAGLNRFNNC